MNPQGWAGWANGYTAAISVPQLGGSSIGLGYFWMNKKGLMEFWPGMRTENEDLTWEGITYCGPSFPSFNVVPVIPEIKNGFAWGYTYSFDPFKISAKTF